MWYRIAGYFCGVVIFIIFVVHPGVTKFSTHCSAVNACSNLDQRRFVMALFATYSALGPPSPLSQAVLAEEVNREVQKAEVLPKENEPITSRSTWKSLK